MTRGLTIGKFYPPHRGHKHLIDSAMKQVDELTVLVCDRKDYTIPAELRAAWLREIHPGARILVIDDCVADDDSKGWAEYTLRILGFRPDVVFTSEDYGEAYAFHMGSRHAFVDRERVAVPISGTEIRADALKNWNYLEPCVRAYFAKRVAIVGAESTGKTSLARDLAAHYATAWVPEFGRMYSEAKLCAPDANTWKTAEFVFIASEQNRIEDALARTCNRVLFCDTNAFSTNLWHERYLGSLSPEVDALSSDRKYDLHLLANAEIPFVPDGLRDGFEIRAAMHKRFVEELQRHGKPFVALAGAHAQRLRAAIEVCDRILVSA
jgi:NadR type nicotinamide-nucleotide adenylyltransferase